MCTARDSDQIPAELIQAGCIAVRSEIHNITNSVLNREFLPQQ